MKGLKLGVLALCVTFVAGSVMPASSKRPASPEAKAAYAKMVSATKALGTSAQRIAKGEVPMKDMPQVMLYMCKRSCEASYHQCVAFQVDPGIPDFSGRPPKDFPIEIPDCEGPDCDRGKPVSKPGPSCTKVRDTCLRHCDCQFIS